jgi:energy-coupling factor transport system permease protein
LALRPGDRPVAGSAAAGQGVTKPLNARAVAAWSAACLFIVLFTTNPAYKAMVLAAAIASLAAGAGLHRMRGLLTGVVLIASFATLLNFVSAHLGTTVLFELPDTIPGIGGPYTLEALAAGLSGGLTVGAAIVAAAPFSLMLASHDVMDALPAALSRTGAAIAASLNLVPSVAASFVQVSEAQRLRGWRPRGPRSWAEVVVPVVLTSVEGSIQLAESMEARGFGSGPRTSLRSSPLRRSDWLLAGASAAAVIAFTAAHVAGWAADWYPYPTLALPSIGIVPLVACLLLFAPVVAWRSRA